MSTLGTVLLSVGVAVSVLVATSAVTLVGLGRFRAMRGSYRARLRAVAPHLGAVVFVLVLNGVLREVISQMSWLVGWNVTGLIHALEGNVVAVLQAAATPPMTAFLSGVYVYGYPFLLVFPFVAYLVAPKPEPLAEVSVAFVVNYAGGLVCYVLFVAYGPRNVLPGLVESLLYATYPETQLLVTEVNTNTNVFPSLHTSLSTAVALLAWRTRQLYPRWAAVAAVGAVCVALSTMYLGIHWLTDVVAGAALGAASVWVAARYVARSDELASAR
jgi:membrane-associated phospholipid phosphatase